MRYIIGLFVTATIVFLLGSLRVGAEIQNYESALWVALVLSVLNIAYYVYDIGSFLVGYQCYYCVIGSTIGRGLSSIWILGCCNV